MDNPIIASTRHVDSLNEIILGKRGITADRALRLSRLLKTSPQLWMRLQADWDLH
jgi:addiction module HigA family antidote